jgi:hypothetical protein
VDDDRDIVSISLRELKETQQPDFRALCSELVKTGTDYIFDDREVVEFDQALAKARAALQETAQPSTLVKDVGKAIAATCKPGTGHVLFWDDAAKAAILAVAEWLLTEGASNAYCGSIAAKLEFESEKNDG